MKREKKLVKVVHIYLSVEQYEEFLQAYHTSIYRKKCQYARKMLLGKPVTTIFYARKMLLGKPVTTIFRNRSLDDFIESSVRIKKELKKILAMDAFTPAEREEVKIRVNHVVGGLIKIVEQCSRT